jgi:hypothetical protein
MAFRLQMGLQGETQIDRILGISAAGVTDFTKPLEDSRTIILDRVQQNFDKRGALFGGWKPRTKAYPWPTLEKTGKMRRSFVGKVSPTEMEVTNTDKEKFRIHQSNEPRTKIPRRIMLQIDGPSAILITKAFQLYLVGLLRGNK